MHSLGGWKLATRANTLSVPAADEAVCVSWQRPAYALAVGTIEWPQLDLRVTFLDDPCCWPTRWRYALSPWSARVSLRRNGGPECLPTFPVNCWGLISSIQCNKLSVLAHYSETNLSNDWARSSPVELTKGACIQTYRIFILDPPQPLLEVWNAKFSI